MQPGLIDSLLNYGQDYTNCSKILTAESILKIQPALRFVCQHTRHLVIA